MTGWSVNGRQSAWYDIEMLLVRVTIIARCPSAEQDSLLYQLEIDHVPERLPGPPVRGPDGTAGHACPDRGHSISYRGLAQEFVVIIAYDSGIERCQSDDIGTLEYFTIHPYHTNYRKV